MCIRDRTTIVNLLMRFYDVDSGSILLSGHDVADYSRASTRSRFGMVLQDTWLFGGTIAENVAFGKPDATREEIIRACDEAYCDHFIRTLPQGYDTVIGSDTSSISSGQKQLLTIARALLAQRELLILDEATSNVDTRTELLIQKAMDRLMRGRTCFIIAHRLSTIVDRRWAMMKQVRPRMRRSIAFWMSSSVRVSTLDVASSRISSSRCASRARAMVSSCFWPEEMDEVSLPMTVS